MRHRAAAVASLSLVLLAPVAAGAQPATTPAATPPSPTYWTESPSGVVPADIQRLNDFMNGLAERMKPALVQVRVRRAVDPSDAPEQPPRSPGQPPSPPEEGRRASGSGFIIRQDGYLVTNAHVVDDAEQIQIKLSDGRRFAGRLVGMDTRVDLALVKINATGLPVATLGDSNRLRVGEFVLALGHPFGLEQTVSFGIVSRKGAPLEVAAPGFDFIQTDAAVNPGNSGGPLVNMAGEVMGVNSMAARNGSIGFAIPVNLVKGLLPQLAEKGKVEWGWLGVTIAEIGEDDAPKYGLSEPRGVLIRNVVVGQPADKGGVKANDVIMGVDGATLEGPRDLQRIISATPVGRTVKLKVWREGKATELDVVIGVYQGPGRTPPRRAPERTPAPPTEPAPPK
jgi:serine protease Do